MLKFISLVLGFLYPRKTLSIGISSTFICFNVSNLIFEYNVYSRANLCFSHLNDLWYMISDFRIRILVQNIKNGWWIFYLFLQQEKAIFSKYFLHQQKTKISVNASSMDINHCMGNFLGDIIFFADFFLFCNVCTETISLLTSFIGIVRDASSPCDTINRFD